MNEPVDDPDDLDGLRRRLRLDDGTEIEVESGPEGATTIRGQMWRLPLGVLTPALRDALRALSDGADEEDIARDVREREGLEALTRWSTLVQCLLDSGALQHTLTTGSGRRLATISALAPGATISLSPPNPSQAVALSRFALLRAVDGEATLESPLGRARIRMHDPRLAAVVAGLATPSSGAALAAATRIGVDVVVAFLGMLDGACALATTREAELDADSQGLPLWEVHDALFHSRSRLGRRDLTYGATYRFDGLVDPLPAVAPARGSIIPLVAPDLSMCVATDPTFAAVLEARRSRRRLAPEPVDVSELSEFLYRACRNTGDIQIEVDHPATEPRVGAPIATESDVGSDRIRMERTTRPYPGAGGCHPLEVYVVAHRCAGLAPGMYRYEPTAHGLVACHADSTDLARLLAGARSAARLSDDPPVLLIVAARFARIAWKYEGIAYAGVLKDAGGLLQTMYLVATAMGLAPCAIGGGDAECFAAAAGTEYWEESSVAEFVLGHHAGEIG